MGLGQNTSKRETFHTSKAHVDMACLTPSNVWSADIMGTHAGNGLPLSLSDI
ncbi:hypothetical protein NBRC116594_10390 [Shimia sp. NS0008-38b]